MEFNTMEMVIIVITMTWGRNRIQPQLLCVAGLSKAGSSILSKV